MCNLSLWGGFLSPYFMALICLGSRFIKPAEDPKISKIFLKITAQCLGKRKVSYARSA